MAGKRDEGAADWLDGVFDQLRALTDQAIAVTAAAAAPVDVAEAEKRARAIGVLARTAKVVAGLKPSAARKTPEEDAMSEDDRDLTDAELDGLQAEFYARVDHLVGVVERKAAAAGLGREPAARAEAGGADGGVDGDAAPERRPGLAA